MRRVYHRARDTSAALYRAFDATPEQAAALFAIRSAGALSQGGVGDAIAMEPANAHGLVQRMKAKGWIESTRDPADPRRLRIALTEAGAAVEAGLAEAAKRSEARTLAALTKPERVALFALLEKMIEHDDS